MSTIKGEFRSLAKKLNSLADDMDYSGWMSYPDTAPEDPKMNPDDMPRQEDYPLEGGVGYDYERFDAERFEWIDQNLDRYLVCTKGGRVMILYWGGNDYEWLNENGYSVSVVAWMPLPEAPTIEEVA